MIIISHYVTGCVNTQVTKYQVAARVWFNVEVSSHFNGIKAIVYNSTLKDTASFEVTSLEPDTCSVHYLCHSMQHGRMQRDMHVMYTSYKQN